MYSIFHFFKSLVSKKQIFKENTLLENFPYDETMLSCKNVGQFPDLAIKISIKNPLFTGGELLELKDSDSYKVSSFNSTIPTRKKEIKKIIKGEKSQIKQQMEAAGDDIYSLPMRDVFYLVRGKKKGKQKICLVDGSFFETVNTNQLISESFSQVLEERLSQRGEELTDEMKALFVSMFSEQENFSKVRNVDKASIKLRFRIMTEVKAEGNILNEKKYPQIKNDTLNFIIPCHDSADEKLVLEKMSAIYTQEEMQAFFIFKLKHILNGYFMVFQAEL